MFVHALSILAMQYPGVGIENLLQCGSVVKLTVKKNLLSDNVAHVGPNFLFN